jgi:hypothetical protein
MIIFSALVVIDRETEFLTSSILLTSLSQIWVTWYSVKLFVLNAIRAALHLGFAKSIRVQEGKTL